MESEPYNFTQYCSPTTTNVKPKDLKKPRFGLFAGEFFTIYTADGVLFLCLLSGNRYGQQREKNNWSRPVIIVYFFCLFFFCELSVLVPLKLNSCLLLFILKSTDDNKRKNAAGISVARGNFKHFSQGPESRRPTYQNIIGVFIKRNE